MLARKSGNIINMASVASSIKGKYYYFLIETYLHCDYKWASVIHSVVYGGLALCS